ncbi:MAG: glutaminase A [Bacillota bacterium]|nr:glutaminase A [Bacillota bacterium]MDW7677719.1 glutaminase A [Bacillota bacterium]
MQERLEKLICENRHWTKQGAVATYIPELSKQSPDLLGISVCDAEGNFWCAGDWEAPFTIQSICKVATFLCVLQDNNFEQLTKKISVAPTSDGFNSIVNLETKNEHRPLNAMINSGAIASISLVKGATIEDKFDRILTMIREMAGNNSLQVNETVYLSEKRTGDRNRALAYFMKSTGIISVDVEDLLDAYFRLCSVEVTCRDISAIGAVLACDGTSPITGRQLCDAKTSRIVKAVMTTCGLYDGSGEFAVDVGMPGKSGVGGGILAVSPRRMGIGVMGPALDSKGNSIGGWKMLHTLSEEWDLTIF